MNKEEVLRLQELTPFEYQYFFDWSTKFNDYQDYVDENGNPDLEKIKLAHIEALEDLERYIDYCSTPGCYMFIWGNGNPLEMFSNPAIRLYSRSYTYVQYISYLLEFNNRSKSSPLAPDTSL